MVLRDDMDDMLLLPRKRNILKGFDWLMRDLQPGDRLFFYFSGGPCRVGDGYLVEFLHGWYWVPVKSR